MGPGGRGRVKEARGASPARTERGSWALASEREGGSAGARAPRILLVRLGALGDIVHAIPVAAALRRAFPAARIDWLVSAKHREILDLVPVIDRRLVISDRPSAGQGVKTNGTSLFAA